MVLKSPQLRAWTLAQTTTSPQVSMHQPTHRIEKQASRIPEQLAGKARARTRGSLRQAAAMASSSPAFASRSAWQNATRRRGPSSYGFSAQIPRGAIRKFADTKQGENLELLDSNCKTVVLPLGNNVCLLRLIACPPFNCSHSNLERIDDAFDNIYSSHYFIQE